VQEHDRNGDVDDQENLVGGEHSAISGLRRGRRRAGTCRRPRSR
jgi:hypothetical protein